ncbi:MAG: glycosyltransferase family 2 protein [Rhodobacteraceae bacterium]|nr:glycosyltransferase family 2 protein [Paracoccaceae bacterium]
MVTLPASTSATPAPDVSIVVPLKDEAQNIAPLVQKMRTALAPIARYEIVLVDDGSGDDTRTVILGLMAEAPEVRLIGHAQSGGQSAAVHSGVLAARAPIIATLDGDGQNPPENLPLLLAPLLNPAADPRLGLVAGQRVGRRDTWSKRMASRFANALRSAVLSDGTRDTGCGLKAFRRDAFLALPFFNHQHRYLPALFARDGWAVAHVDVTHAARLHGWSKYGNLGRAMVGAVDLVGVAWLIRRRKTILPTEIHAPAPVTKEPVDA